MKWLTGLFTNDGTYHKAAHVYDGEPDRCESYCQKCINENPDFRLQRELSQLEAKYALQVKREEINKRIEELKRSIK